MKTPGIYRTVWRVHGRRFHVQQTPTLPNPIELCRYLCSTLTAAPSSGGLLGSGTTISSMLLCSWAKHLSQTKAGESSDLWFPQCKVSINEIGGPCSDGGGIMYCWSKGQFGQGFPTYKAWCYLLPPHRSDWILESTHLTPVYQCFHGTSAQHLLGLTWSSNARNQPHPKDDSSKI